MLAVRSGRLNDRVRYFAGFLGRSRFTRYVHTPCTRLPSKVPHQGDAEWQVAALQRW